MVHLSKVIFDAVGKIKLIFRDIYLHLQAPKISRYFLKLCLQYNMIECQIP